MTGRRTYEYEIPERMMVTKAHAPLNRLMTKMTNVASRSVSDGHDPDRHTYRIKFFVENEAMIDKAAKIDGQIRALLATGGE